MAYAYGITEQDNILFRTGGQAGIERYDPETNTWVVDFALLGVYSDDIPFVVISEEEARRRLYSASA